MKYLLHTLLLSIIITIVFTQCKTELRTPPPPLTYFGDETKIQNPLSPEESQKHIQLPAGFTAELFAAEPNIINPIQFAWDERGRLWVVQSQDYPHELENEVGGDRITICEDTDGDGKADSFTDFATKQSLTTGIVIVKGGAIVAQAPEMVFLEDTNGDDKMDKRTVLFDGFGIWDTHAGPSSLRYGHDNQIWGAVGYSGFEHTFGDKKVEFTRGVYRFGREGKSFEPLGQFNNNTWGLGINADGEIFGSTANNNHACYVGIPLRHYDYLYKLPHWAINADFIQGHYDITPVDTVPLQQVDVRGGYTAAAGANFYSAKNYPKKYQNQMYVNAPTGHLVHIANIEDDGAGYKEVDGGNIFASTDAWTAPVFTQTGPDGNLWVADWYNPVIQHNPDARGMPNQIWNDNKGNGNAHLNEHRDKRHGRIYIIKYKGKSDNQITSLDRTDSKSILAAMTSDNIFWRLTAQRLIVESQDASYISQLSNLLSQNMKSYSGMHLLHTLDGLGGINHSSDEVHPLVESALIQGSPGLQKAALSLIPESDSGSTLLVKSGLLTTSDLHVRLAAALRASELPDNESLYSAMETFAGLATNQEDKWLNAAANIYFRVQNTQDIEPEKVTMIIPASDQSPTEWSYTFDKPSSNWMNTSFDDTSWKKGQSVFGKTDNRHTIGTKWETNDIWLRKTFTLNAAITKPVIKVAHDEDYEVYIDGQLVWEEKGWQSAYKYMMLDGKFSSLLDKGDHTLAVHCVNTGGDQFIDVGIGQPKTFAADKTIALTAVPSQMAYDQKLIYATAGTNLEIRLDNTDEMQHNLVLIEQGATEAFGKIVDQFLKNPEAADMEYIPKTRYVLAATKMLDPGEKDVIQIRVPDKPGDYPYICTFPGHWRMMQGILRVTAKGTFISEDPDAISIANMGGGGSHDFEKYFGLADGTILHQQGMNTVRYTEDSNEFTSLITESDILMISNNKPFEHNTKQAIFDHVNAGKSMLIYHPSAWYNWKAWPAYNRDIVSGGSRSHEPLQEFEVLVKNPNHPIMKGIPKQFKITDELYRWELDPRGPGIEVLAVGRGIESGATFPVVFVVKHKRSKIVVNTLGHDGDAHGLEAYQRMLENSLNWVKRGLPES